MVVFLLLLFAGYSTTKLGAQFFKIPKGGLLKDYSAPMGVRYDITFVIMNILQRYRVILAVPFANSLPVVLQPIL